LFIFCVICAVLYGMFGAFFFGIRNIHHENFWSEYI
jgi:hypothetical protein